MGGVERACGGGGHAVMVTIAWLDCQLLASKTLSSLAEPFVADRHCSKDVSISPLGVRLSLASIDCFHSGQSVPSQKEP